MNCAYFDGSTWQHALFGDDIIGGDIGSAASGGAVFFRGQDQQLHIYNYLGTSGWVYTNFTVLVSADDGELPHADTNIAVNEDGSIMVYRTKGNSLAIIYETSPGTYSYNWVPVFVGAMVRINFAGNVIFYTDVDNNLCMYYYEGGLWNNMNINTATGPINVFGAFDILRTEGKDNPQVYFQGADGYMQVAYILAGQWVVGHFLCPPEPESRKCLRPGAYISAINGMVIYQGKYATVTGPDSVSLADYYNFKAYYSGKGDAIDDND